MLIISLICLYGRKDINLAYWNNQAIPRMLAGNNPNPFSKVTTLDSLYAFLGNDFGYAVFVQDNLTLPGLWELNELVGTVWIWRMRTNKVACKLDASV